MSIIVTAIHGNIKYFSSKETLGVKKTAAVVAAGLIAWFIIELNEADKRDAEEKEKKSS